MRDWIRAAAIFALVLAGWMSFFRLVHAEAILPLSGSSSSGALSTVDMRGQDGVRVNGTENTTVTATFFLIDLGVQITTDTWVSNAGQPITLNSANGFVIIDATDILTATNVNVLANIASVSAAITTISVDVIQARNIVQTQFKNDLGWSLGTSAGANTTTMVPSAGAFTINVNSASGGLILAAGDWYGAGLAFLTTVNVTQLNATLKVSATAVESQNVSSTIVSGLTAFMTTVNVTRLNATGPTGTVSATIGLSQNATTSTLAVGTINGTTPGTPIAINQLGGITLSQASGLNGTNISAALSTLNIDVDGVGGRLKLGGTDIMEADRHEALGASGTVSSTILLVQDATATTLIATRTVSATTVLAGTVNVSAGGVNTSTIQSPTNNTSLTLAGNPGLPVIEIKADNWVSFAGTLGMPTLAVTGAMVMDRSRGYAPFLQTVQGRAALERTYNVTTETSPTITGTGKRPVGTQFFYRKGALTTGGYIHYEASGRLGINAGETMTLNLMSGIGGATSLAGPNGAFNVDATTTVLGAVFAIDWTFTLREPPDAATRGQGGGWAGVQTNNATTIALGSNNIISPFRLLAGDLGGETSPDLTADTPLELFVTFASASANNSIFLRAERFEMCQPHQ